MPIENVNDADRNTIKVAGVNLTVPAPFVEGHVLRPNEAAVLNQTYSENLRNNFASTVKKAIEEAKGIANVDVSALQEQMDKYIQTYDFGVRSSGGGSRSLNPIEREAMNIARSKVRSALKKTGKNVKDYTAEQINKLAEQAVEKYPQLMEQAKKIVALREAVGNESLDLGGVEPEKAPEEGESENAA